jgi:hypothetical protein
MRSRHEVYRDGKVHVMAERCTTCIYRPDGLSLRPGGLKGLTEAAKAEVTAEGITAGHIPCHNTYPPLAEPGVRPAICRGFWDLPDRPVLLRLAQAQGIVVYDAEVRHPDGLSSEPPAGPII